MVPIFKVNVEFVINAANSSTTALLKFLLEKGIIYECQTYYPGTCCGCIFESFKCRDCWVICDTNIIYKWNYQSKNYVGEDRK